MDGHGTWAPALLLVLGSVTTAAAQDDVEEAERMVVETIVVDLEDGGELAAERGVLTIPIVRSDPRSTPIQIEFHRFSTSAGETDRPPIFLLRGGPGFRGLGPQLAREGFYERNSRELAAVADVVVVGQRGIGSSTPDTRCKPRERETLDAAVSAEEAAALVAEGCRRCREHWEAEGLELEGLNVLEAADDVVEIATLLGYRRITLVGGSFGSHWGMVILRRHRERVARVLLSGLEGPDHTYDMPSGVLRSLERIAAAAEASPRLAEHVPEGGLLAAFADAVARVEAEPVMVEAGTTRVLIDGRRLRGAALGTTARTGSRRGIRTWPADVLRILEGDLEAVAWALVRENFVPGLPTASFFMLDCGSGISTERRATLLADPAAEIVGALGSFYEAACPVWGSDLGEDFRRNFETDVPAILVHGTWDTSTPFDNALELEPFFENGKLVVVEGGSHGAFSEALQESPGFRAEVMEFLATGDMEGVPELVELGPLDWEVPGE